MPITNTTRRIGCLLVAGLLLPAVAPAWADSLKIGGTGTDLGTMRMLGEAFRRSHPGVTIDVPPSLGSSGGIKAVLAGALDLAISSRPPHQPERERGARETAYAQTPFVLATSQRTPVAGLSEREVYDIYTGAKTAWADGTDVRLVLRPESESDSALFKQYFPALVPTLTRLHAGHTIPVAYTDQDAADRIEQTPGAIGTISLSLILAEGRRLKPLALEGVHPSATTIADGSYRLVKTLYLITGPHPPPLVRSFLEFVRSPVGKGILERTGHRVLDVGPSGR